jgi:hypothetical protein
MKEKDPYTVGDDLPKVNPWTEDRLGFAPFAERLARVIRTLRVPNGYVMASMVSGAVAKTTALNFVNEYLKKHNEETTDGQRQQCREIDGRKEDVLKKSLTARGTSS